jgi:hypothetical protein
MGFNGGPSYYRQKARQLHAEAEKCQFADAKLKLLTTAQEYEILAEHTERLLSRSELKEEL